MIRPSKNDITLGFGATSDPYSPSNPHRGTDFSYLPDDTIYAPADGVVTLIPNNGNDGNGIYMTAEGAYLGMLHTSKYLVSNQQFVKAGQPIAVMGETGYAFGKHLHWAAKVGGQFVDPMTLINQEGDKIMADIKIVGTPASVSNATSRIDIVAMGSDNGLYHKWFDGKWYDWERWGGGIATAPSISSWDKDRFDIFATGIAGDVMHFWYANGKINGPESLGKIKE